MKKMVTGILVFVMMCSLCSVALASNDEEYYTYFSGTMSELKEDFKSGKYGDEVYYLFEGVWGGSSKRDIAVFKRGDTPVAVLYEDDKRCSECVLTENEYNDFVSYMKEIDADNLPSWDTGMISDGMDNKYVHISKDGEYSVYINNGWYDGYEDGSNQIYVSLIEKFKDLFKDKEVKTYYDIDGAELIINNKDYKVRAVYKNGDDFRVLINNKDKLANTREKLEWYYFRDNKVAERAEEPEEFTLANAWDNAPKDDVIMFEHLNNYPWLTSWGEYNVSIYKKDKNGLRINGIYIVKTGEEPKLVSQGTYSGPVVIPNTDYVVVQEGAEGWTKPRKLVKINLKTGEKTDMNFPEANSISPIMWINDRLLVGYKPNNETLSYEYYMYNIEDDTKEQVWGDFGCLSYLEGKMLQKTSQPDKYFTLGSQNTVGIFNTETYKFSELITLPVTIYNNDYIWVDEEESKLYLVLNEDLVSVPININLSPESGNITIILNGEELSFDNPPVIKTDRTLVPFRKIFESLGYTVEWNEENSMVTAKKGDAVMYLQIGNNEITVNDKKVISDTAPELINSTTYIPFRIISEQSNCDVEWNDKDRSVIINSVNQ